MQKKIEKDAKKINDQKELIQKLKAQNNRYKQLLDNIEKHS